jgi:hypothetical protein
MLKFWKIATFLLATSFLAENMGFFTHQMNLAIGVLCLVTFALLYFPGQEFKETAERFKAINKIWAAIGLVTLILAFFLLRYEPLLRLMGLCLFLVGFDVFLRSIKRQERELPVLLAALIGFTLFMALVKYTPMMWAAMNDFSLYISRFVSLVTRKDILLGATFTGIYSTVLFALFAISWYVFSLKKKAWHLPVVLVSLLLVNVIYVVLFAYLPSLLHAFPFLTKGIKVEPGAPLPAIPDRYLFNLPIILFVFLLVPLYFQLRKIQFHPMSLMPKKAETRFIIPCLLLFAFAIGSLTISFPVKSVADKEVVFYEKGFVNWLTPNFEGFGSNNVGMFGNLPSFVESMGLKSRFVAEITEDSLSGAKVLVLININEEVSQSEIETLWEFVRDGGSLLLMGDHTWYDPDKNKNWLNEVLKPVSIKLNFDTADFFIGGWLHSYEYAAHPITYYLGDEENEAGIVAGASLEAKYPAVPIIMGRYGYSDTGDISASDRGYLGNMEYDMPEQIGDAVLVAEQRYGKGKVLVFGDTSSFVNAILVNDYPFINRVFTWLASDDSPRPYLIQLVFCLVFLAGAAALFFRTSKNVATLFFGVLIMLLIVVSAVFISSRNIERPLTGNIAYVDASHFERFSMESWREDGNMGLHLNLMRNGYLSFQTKILGPKEIANCDLLVIIAPSKPFTKSEVRMLETYVKNGGRLILTVGWEERSASRRLLEAFDFRLEEIPLGNFRTNVPNTEEMAMFYAGWPVYPTDAESLTIISATKPFTTVEVLCGYDQYPVLSLRNYGKGKLVVVGDSAFLINKNLEMEETYFTDNVNFLRWLLTRLAAP